MFIEHFQNIPNNNVLINELFKQNKKNIDITWPSDVAQSSAEF